MLNEAFWNGRRVLVTGHAGFKGSWLCAWLTRLGAEVTGLGHVGERRPSLFAAAGLAARMTSLALDVRDAGQLRQAVVAAAPEVIFHLAAQPLVLAGVRDPLATFGSNVMGTVNLLDAARHVPSVCAILVVTSDKCYRDGSLVCDETGALGGEEPYGVSKACAELVTTAYRSTYFAPLGVGVATARAGNVIGAGDMAADRLIPDLVRAHLAGKTALLRRPEAVRPWQHVLDALSGYLQLAELLAEQPELFAEAWNFGPDSRSMLTAGELAAMFLGEIGGGTVAAAAEPSRHEAAVLRLSALRAQRRLGWRPLLGTPEAVRWTAQGYTTFLRDGSARWLDEQIDRYSARLAPPSRLAAPAAGELSYAQR